MDKDIKILFLFSLNYNIFVQYFKNQSIQTMKKLIFLLILISGFLFTTLSAQLLTSSIFETGPDSLQGVRDTLIVYSPYIDGYWDYSIQLKSTFAGLGDSTNFMVSTWQSNDQGHDAWTDITTLRDTLATITDESAILIEKTDFTGLWLKHIIVSLSLDTMLINTYQVKKKFRLY